MTSRQDERGFTLVELMIGILLLSVLSIGFYQVMFSAVRGSNDASDIAEVSEEARLGFNRMIRDTRETTKLVSASEDDYRIWVDYDRDGCVDAGTAFVVSGTTCVAGGDSGYEFLHYAFDGARITLTALQGPGSGAGAACAVVTPPPACGLDPAATTPMTGTTTETLAANVVQVPGQDVFTYASNFLEFDSNGNGEVSAAELEAGTVGDDNNTLSGYELDYVSDVNYQFRVRVGDAVRTFFGQAQIRNRRYSNL